MRSNHKIILALALVLFITVVYGLNNAGESSGQKFTLVAVISQELRTKFLDQIAVLLKLIQNLQRQLNELIAKQAEETEVSAPAEESDQPAEEVVTPALPSPPVVSLPTPFESTLTIEVTYPSRRVSSRNNNILTELRFSADEKIGITRIRFKNSGDLPSFKLVSLELINSSNQEVLAIVDSPTGDFIEFQLTADPDKDNKGLIVSGGLYYVIGSNFSHTKSTRPKIRLDVESVSDIDAFDYDDLTRVADISKTISFPIIGPEITTF